MFLLPNPTPSISHCAQAKEPGQSSPAPDGLPCLSAWHHPPSGLLKANADPRAPVFFAAGASEALRSWGNQTPTRSHSRPCSCIFTCSCFLLAYKHGPCPTVPSGPGRPPPRWSQLTTGTALTKAIHDPWVLPPSFRIQLPEFSAVPSADQLEVLPPPGCDTNARFSSPQLSLLRLVLYSFHQDGPQVLPLVLVSIIHSFWVTSDHLYAHMPMSLRKSHTLRRLPPPFPGPAPTHSQFAHTF